MVFSTDCKTVALAFTSVSTERKCILQGHSWMLIRIVLGKKFVQDTKLVVKYEVYSFSLFQNDYTTAACSTIPVKYQLSFSLIF